MNSLLAAVASGIVSGMISSGAVGVILNHRLSQSRAEHERHQTAHEYWTALRTEMTLNSGLCDRPIVGETKVELRTQQWDNSAPHISNITEKRVQLVVEAYSAVQRYNSAVEQERVKVKFGYGHMDSELRQLAAAAKTALDQAIVGWQDM